MEKLTKIDNEIRFAEWRKKEGVKRFLFDLDDTICPTRQIFREIMSQAIDFLAVNATINDREKWKDEVETVNNRLFEQFGVNPIRWNYVVDELADRYYLDQRISQKAKHIFQQIYSTPLIMSEGSEEGLSFIKKVGIPIGIVTHAGLEWTLKKYNWLDLKRFTTLEEVFIVDENGHKTTESWLQAIKYFGINPTECAVVGDSPRSDINPAMKAGVKHCFLLEDPLQWSVHNQPVDLSVRKISRLDQISEIILGSS